MVPASVPTTTAATVGSTREELSQQSGACPGGGLRRCLLLFDTSLHMGQEILTESSADPDAVSGAVVNCVDP